LSFRGIERFRPRGAKSAQEARGRPEARRGDPKQDVEGWSAIPLAAVEKTSAGWFFLFEPAFALTFNTLAVLGRRYTHDLLEQPGEVIGIFYPVSHGNVLDR
jgi:hypothetical protein